MRATRLPLAQLVLSRRSGRVYDKWSERLLPVICRRKKRRIYPGSFEYLLFGLRVHTVLLNW